jgi:hypothetical protein
MGDATALFNPHRIKPAIETDRNGRGIALAFGPSFHYLSFRFKKTMS